MIRDALEEGESNQGRRHRHAADPSRLQSKVHVGEADNDPDGEADEYPAESEVPPFGRAIGEELTGFILSISLFERCAVFVVGEVEIIGDVMNVGSGRNGVVLRAILNRCRASIRCHDSR